MDTGTVLGAASLAIQLSGVCSQGYSTVITTLAASRDTLSLALQFDIENARFEDFKKTVGLEGTQDDAFCKTSIIVTPVLLHVLKEIDLAIQRLIDPEVFPEPLPSDYADPATPGSTTRVVNLRGILAHIQQRATPSGFGSFKWSILRKTETGIILRRLVRCNDFLHELLDIQQLRDLQRLQKESYLSIVQMQSSLEDMRTLTLASTASQNLHRQSHPWQRAADMELQNLAAFKAIYTALPNVGSSTIPLLEVNAAHIELCPTDHGSPAPSRAMYREAGHEVRSVWINWQDRNVSSGEAASAALLSLKELTLLLQTPKPDEFCILPCVGYSFLRPPGEEQQQAALIFELPAGTSPALPPHSLYDAFTTHTKPSLTGRVALAHRLSQSLLYFHAVNWLHKALRSGNLFFFPSTSSTANTELDLSKPYIAGFDHTRPARWGEATNPVPRLSSMEVYRHPDTQHMGPQLSFRKTFDIYSLGLLLAEIAFWKPIVTIMDIKTTVTNSPTVAYGVRELWLTSQPDLLKRLRAEIGDKYADVVEFCLQGRDAFGIERRNEETSADAGMIIQRLFSSQVVKALADIIL